MIEAVMLWNEPNNKSHWDPELDPEWKLYAQMVIAAGQAVAAENAALPRVLGGVSPIYPSFISNKAAQRGLGQGGGVAVHGFPPGWDFLQNDDSAAKHATKRGGT